jgi:transcriptional regulator with XRE-family HTH domain
VTVTTSFLFAMEFPERLTTLRKQSGLTQLALADRVGVTVLQIQRYEKGTSQPTLDVIRRLALALSVSADDLVFDKEERGPGSALRYQFEAISQLGEDEQAIIQELLEGMIIKYQTRRWDSRRRPTKADAA